MESNDYENFKGLKLLLVDYTGIGCGPNFAANLLIFSKSTRLKMDSSLRDDIEGWDEAKRLGELEYISNTIPSSWEFIHYTFVVHNCTRAFTAQLCRGRHASFAERTLRMVNASPDGEPFSYLTGPSVKSLRQSAVYASTMRQIDENYKELVASGVAIEDARGVLPLNIHTAIMGSLNMRTFCEMNRKRVSPRVQGEYRQFMELLKTAILAVHPWMEIFLNKSFDAAAKRLDEMILDFVTEPQRATMLKLVDQMRQMASS